MMASRYVCDPPGTMTFHARKPLSLRISANPSGLFDWLS